jgi:acyl-homoserine lactone acylase PvdQ
MMTARGGASGDPASPHYADRLAKWLTADYDPMVMDPSEVEAQGAREEFFAPPDPES